MNFKTHKINFEEPERKPLKTKKRLKLFDAVKKKTEDNYSDDRKKIPKLGINLIVLSLVLLIIGLGYGIFKTISNIDYSIFLKMAGTKLLTDEEGQSNFLLLGIGGEKHDGGDLTDAIMLVSLDQQTNHISMVSLPRDLHIKNPTIQTTRINEIYHYAKRHFNGNERKGVELLKEAIEEYTNTEIQYYLLIDFQGFVEVINILGGIEVDVDKDLYDPYYPLDGTIYYQTFSVKKGINQMDGETALKYARSRQTTNDFDRSERQKKIIQAVKDKVLKTSFLLSVDKISETLNSLRNNIITNITPGEILTLASIAKDFTNEDISTHPLHDNHRVCGGLLYAPPRNEFGGAFVLLPAGGSKYLHNYFNLILNYPHKNKTPTKIHVLNSTKKAGAATQTKNVLTRYCFEINRFGNGRSQDITETTYYYKSLDEEETRPDYLDFLQEIIPGKETTEIPEEYLSYIENTDIILELGSDYTFSEQYLQDPIHYLILATPRPQPKTESTETIETSANTEEGLTTTTEE